MATSDEDRRGLRWAHERLTSMGYEPVDGEDQQHPVSW
jgi:hypothetical protein